MSALFRTKTAKGQSKMFRGIAKFVNSESKYQTKMQKQQALLKAKYVSAKSGPEPKYCDTTFNTAFGQQEDTDLLVIAQGSDNTERIGRKITLNKIQYTLSVSASAANLANAALVQNGALNCRVSLVYDKQPNGASATYNFVYLVNATNSPYTARNLNYIDRFDVLATDNIQINAAGPTAQQIQRYIKCSLETRYDGTGSGIGNIESGNLLLMFSCDAISGTPATLAGVVRVVYTDM